MCPYDSDMSNVDLVFSPLYLYSEVSKAQYSALVCSVFVLDNLYFLVVDPYFKTQYGNQISIVEIGHSRNFVET